MPSDGEEDGTYAEEALERGRPTDPCICSDCNCFLHTYPEDDSCIWCRNGDHRPNWGGEDGR